MTASTRLAFAVISDPSTVVPAALGAAAQGAVCAVAHEQRAPVQIIEDCIRHCAAAKDGRGRWREERACAEALSRMGSPAIAASCAGAARRIGEWLKTAG
jgi:hypothetical protein